METVDRQKEFLEKYQQCLLTVLQEACNPASDASRKLQSVIKVKHLEVHHCTAVYCNHS